jgi:phage terminase large subunit-like protein
MKPNTSVTCTWSASTTASGSLSAYELRYTVNNGSSYTTISSNIGTSTRTYSFTPQAIDEQQVIVQVRARNSYNKYSSWVSFPTITIYTDGMSVGKVNNSMKHLRAYVKVGGSMHKVNYIKVKIGGVVYNIDQYTPPSS